MKMSSPKLGINPMSSNKIIDKMQFTFAMEEYSAIIREQTTDKPH